MDSSRRTNAGLSSYNTASMGNAGTDTISNTPATRNLRFSWHQHWFILAPLIVNLLTYAVVFPGIDSPDASDQRQQYATWTFNKQHSILDTFFLGFIARNELWLANLLQVFIFSACIITALMVLSSRVSRTALFITTLVWTFFPLFPAYAVSSTKDVLCAGFTLLLCIEVFEAIDSHGAILHSPWFLTGLGLTLFVTNELRKNNFLFVFAIIVFLLITFRSYWKRLMASFLIFVSLSVAWGAYCDYGLKATPSPTTEMLGVPLMQVSYIYYENLHGNPQNLPSEADAYFQAIRSAEQWSSNYDIERSFVMSNKVESLTSSDLGSFLSNWSSLCFANFGTCVHAYVLFEGSLINPMQTADDQYSILAAVLGTDKASASQSPLALIPRIVFNLAAFDWALIALAIVAVRRGKKHLLPLFLIPLGIAISLMLAALAVQIRLMLGAIILIPFLAALILDKTASQQREEINPM
ncbi:DUF6020 family protein [Bifidobacterium tsurumiense]|uniref:DUF6020 family protein n=1 Tax=Bifidobacterium tsurumiense TaxID=356829 RepID=UPI0012B2F9E7|nr:DUF6020 family protein [Bifidobacterium tsurumiense]MSS13273.1 hypothetical protein [Bifidobacterium tsurumiense]